MRRHLCAATAVAMIAALSTFGAVRVAQAQTPAPAAAAFKAGDPLGVVSNGALTPMSSNVKVFGSLVSAESCSYDAERDLIVVPNRGGTQLEAPNDAFVSLFNHDGSVHTTRWIGATRDGLTLNQPFGSDIAGGKLWVADTDGGTRKDEPTTAVLRAFDMKTGAPAGEIKVPASPIFNDIAVAADGTIYASQSGASGDTPDKTTWRLFKVSPDGTAVVFAEGDVLARPNGVAIDGDGNIVVVTIGTDAVLTFSPTGELLKTEHAAQPGNDGLVLMPDGTKYVSSVRNGGVSKITKDGKAELIATGIPAAASMCYDPGANQLVIPMNANNALAFIKL